MDRERVTLIWLGWSPNTCEGASVSAYTWSEDIREGRIRIVVYGRPIDITELKAPINIRSGNKKRLGP
jgi:hypothetical protein